jgi:hypothetical protein
MKEYVFFNERRRCSMIDRSPADVPVLDIEFPASHAKFRESDVSNMRDKVCRVLPSYEGMEIRVLLITPNFSSFDAERSFLNLIKMINPDSINIEVDRKPHVSTDLYFSWKEGWWIGCRV